MTDKPDYVTELRTIARLIETKAPVTGREQDAEHLRNAATEIERLREAVRAERSAILEASSRCVSALRDRGLVRGAPAPHRQRVLSNGRCLWPSLHPLSVARRFAKERSSKWSGWPRIVMTSNAS